MPGTRPTSEILVRPDAVDPLSVWATFAGSVTHYTLYWGDGTSDRRLTWDPPVRHTYPEYGRYLIRGVNLDGMARELWVELSETEPAPAAAPAFAIHPKDSGLRVRVRLLFRPPTADDPYDHRQVPHDIDWGDGVREHVPAGTAVVDRDYLPGQWSWPKERPLPVVTVTDLATGGTTQTVAWAVRPPNVWFVWDAATAGGVRLDTYVVQLPTPDVPYQVWHRGQHVLTRTPDPDATSFAFHHEWPGTGWSSVTALTGDGYPLYAAPVWPKQEQGVCAYDWDWQPEQPTGMAGNPWLILCQPWTYGTTTGPHAAAFHVDWGDGTRRERVALPSDQEQRAAARDHLDNPGAHPLLPHWYAGSGPYTLSITPDKSNGPTSRVIGPCTVSDPVLVDADTVRLDMTTQDAYHPVRVDWGDGTPITREHPAADNPDPRRGSLTHRYTRPGLYGITVYAPVQAPVVKTIRIPDSRDLARPALTAAVGDVHTWDGGYRCSLTVTNHGDQAASWSVWFRLDAPAVLWEVWPTPARYAELGGGRWRIWSPEPVPGHAHVVVKARIEPPGSPEPLPHHLTVHPT